MRCSVIICMAMVLATAAIVAAVDCPDGQYSADDVTCSVCPEYSWARKPSTSINNCQCYNNYERYDNNNITSGCVPTPDVDGDWCPLSNCSATCGAGVRVRTCGCPAPSGKGKSCVGQATVPCVATTPCPDTEPCPAFTYSPSGNYAPDSTNCTRCPPFSWSPAGSTNISYCSCWAGYEGPYGGPCTPVPYVNGGWCNYTECSATCGGGTQTRTCGCPAPQGAGAKCSGPSVAVCALYACDSAGTPCPASTYSRSGKFVTNVNECTPCPASSWSPVGSYNATYCSCWAGYSGPAGGPCTPVTPDTVNGGWCPATVCNATCGGGVQTRRCACPPPSGGGAQCDGAAVLACNTYACVQPCPESYYSSSGTYDSRTSQRCTKCPAYTWSPAGSYAVSNCTCWAGYESINGRCKPVTPQPVDGGWCPASACSATCGGGTQTRVCACPAPSGTGTACNGSTTYACNTYSCSTAPPSSVPCPESTYSEGGVYVPGSTNCTACPKSSWSPAGSVNVAACSCWAGYSGPSGGPCVPVEYYRDGGWCPYGYCNATCGGGYQQRTCYCPAPSGQGIYCPGAAEQPCNTQSCGDSSTGVYYSSTGVYQSSSSSTGDEVPPYFAEPLIVTTIVASATDSFAHAWSIKIVLATGVIGIVLTESC